MKWYVHAAGLEDLFGPATPAKPKTEVSCQRKSEPYPITLYRGFDADLGSLERQGDKLVLSPKRSEAGVMWFSHSLQTDGRGFAESRGSKYLLEYPLVATKHYDLVGYDDGSFEKEPPNDIPPPDPTKNQATIRTRDSLIELPEAFLFSYKVQKHIICDRKLAVSPGMISLIGSPEDSGPGT
jgi:hypothetical protein